MSLDAFFDRVWITTMPEREDRRKRMRRELAGVGLQLSPGRLEFVPGVRVQSADGFPSAGYRGCFLCFLGLLKEAHRLRLRRFLLLEDDVIFHRGRWDAVPRLLHALDNDDWDLAYFAHPLEFHGQPHDGSWHRSQAHFTGADFVGINGRFIPRLLEYMELVQTRPAGHPLGARIAPDAALNLYRDQNPLTTMLLADPVIGGQRFSPSGLSTPYWYDRMPIARSVVRLARDAILRVRHP